MLTKEQIKSHADHRTKVVSVWGGDVTVRSLDVLQMLDLGNIMRMPEGNDRTIALAVFCCGCIVDEDGERMFTDCPEDKKIILRKSDKSLGKIISAVLELASFKDAEAEDIKKNC